ncbi:hypothetical protein DPMN_077954 [Dreissena polymorpha]|uniref:Uncharacterized protein n=1 Tax=Dreissena polymorpha TaxID=45954 RepID=A0A9D3YQY2_DREPO|nr:hypothetical protein DPMN_077954 [Dreissena polymorpha]
MTKVTEKTRREDQHRCGRGLEQDDPTEHITIQGEALEEVERLRYLGNDEGTDVDVRARIEGRIETPGAETWVHMWGKAGEKIAQKRLEVDGWRPEDSV